AESPNVSVNQPIQLRVEFKNPLLNKAAARDEIDCIWTFTRTTRFGSDSSTEKGWVAWHYFSKAGVYQARVSFKDRRTGELIKGGNDEISIFETFQVSSDSSPFFGERARVEITQFAIALGAALLMLVAGAREQLLRMDVAAGLIAVFLIGFSTDTLK